MRKRINVIGCQITRATVQSALHAVVERVRLGSGGYVCFTNVHVSVVARKDPDFQKIVNESFMSLPDGKPIYWVGRLQGGRGLEQVTGPDFLPAVLAVETVPFLKHYFYGGRPEVIAALVKRLKSRFPMVNIAGAESPPFRELTLKDIGEAIRRIIESGANVVWVGLGAPKQERWMAKHWQDLKPAVLLGVGAAFDFHAGSVKRAPAWMRKLGLEWLHRLSQDPARLWKRYVTTNTMFLYYLLEDFLGARWLDQVRRDG